MKNTIFKLFIITISSFLLFVYVFPWHNFDLQVPFGNKEYRLGLDLQGGIELDYTVDLESYRQKEDYTKAEEKLVIEQLKTIIDKRVQVLNINDSEINDASYGGEEHIIVQIPLKGNSEFDNSKNLERAKEAIGRVVKISFRERRTEITPEDLTERKTIAKLAEKDLKSGEDFSLISAKLSLNYENIQTGQAEKMIDIVPEGTDVKTGEMNIVNRPGSGTGFLFVSDKVEGLFDYIFINELPSEWKVAVDSEGRTLTDAYFQKASVNFNQAGQPEVILTFNSEGAQIFGNLTKRLVGNQMAIFVGGELLTAPNINEPIYGGSARITGNYTATEANELAKNINTGVVPAPIYLTSEKTIDSKIGSNSLDKLILAGLIGFALIFVFLIIIYRLSGFMASIALFIYIIIILALVKALGIVLTLASIAGLVLSFGMAIDANILIFERIKNELQKGESIKKATKIGFKETWSAIWDSNVTGLITALILFIVGINLIKGFGLMLGIGIVVSFFTVMVISRVFLEFLVKKIKKESCYIGYTKK